MADDDRPDRAADEKILTHMRDRFAYATDEWADIRREGTKDLRYLAGNPWEDADRTKREKAERPCLSLDELNQYVNQLINDVRQNKRAVKVSPQGGGADDKTADFRANLIRQIEYRSNAQSAYTTTFENAVQRSYGFHQVCARFVSDESFDQELYIAALPNPDLALPDPDGLQPEGSDMRYCFVTESWPIEDFKAKYPRAEVKDFDPDLATRASAWMTRDRIRVGNYWTVTTSRRELVVYEQAPLAPQGQLSVVPATASPLTQAFLDELPKDFDKALIKRSRNVDDTQVWNYLTNGFEILERTKWPGKYIPIVCCYGKVLYLDEGAGTKRKILSLIRLARDPYMLYCYYKSSEAELVGMTPKTPFIGYEGQFRGHERQWQEIAAQPKAYLEARPTTEATGAQILPLPQRQPYDPPIQALEVGAESCRRAIQAAVGAMPLPTEAQRQNQKSGIALKRIQDTSQRGSYHFLDHYDEALRHTGRILNDLIPHYYDTTREVTVRKPDDSVETVQINGPQTDPNQPSIRTDVGEHEVTISTGPSFDSEREQASMFADTLVSIPPFAARLGDLIVKLKNLGPIGDEMADRLIPPEFKKPEQGAPDPQQLQQQAMEAQQQLQQMAQAMAAMKQELDTRAAELASKEKIALADQALAATKLEQEAAQFQAELELKRVELDLKRLKLESDERIALANAAARQQGPPPRRKVVVTKKLDRTPEGMLTGATEEHEELDMPAGM